MYTVKTLAIKNTAEEVVMARKAELKGNLQKQTSMTDDLRIRQFIAVSEIVHKRSDNELTAPV